MASSSTSSYLLFVFLFYNYFESVFLNFSQKFSVIFLVIFSISFSLPTLTFAADCNGSATTIIRESDGEREGERADNLKRAQKSKRGVVQTLTSY